MIYVKIKNILSCTLCVCTASASIFLSGCNFFNNKTDQSEVTQAETTTSQAQTAPAENPDGEIDTSYCYENLSSENVKSIYSKIAQAAQSLEPSEFSLGFEASDKECSEAIFAYENDHPEVFWLDNKYDYILTDGMTSLSLYYIMSNTELEQAKETLEQKAENIVSSAPQNASEFELEEYINDYLCENCEYDYDSYGSNGDLTSSSGNESTAYGALIDGKALCEGYSRAFQLLCNKLGIECVNVFGESKDVLHQWNCVRVGGQWYHMDVTWNDVDDEHMYAKNCYFNLTEEEIKKDHTISEFYSEISDSQFDESNQIYNIYVPSCTSTEYNYFRQTCCSIGAPYNEDEIVQSLADAITNGDSYCWFLIDSDDYSGTVNDITQNYLYTWVSDANHKSQSSKSANPLCGVYQLDSVGVIAVELDYS